METEQCKYCNAPEIYNKSRELCQNCYQYLYIHDRLDKYPKINLYVKKLKERYDDRIVFEFELCMYNLNHNLSKVGRKYGFCRERARQIFDRLFGSESYKTSRKWLKKLSEEKERIIQFHPEAKFNKVKKESSVGKGFKGELIVYDKLKELGFNVSYPIKQSPYDLIINNLKIEVKNSGAFVSDSGKVSYYRGSLTKSELKHSNFVIFYISKTKAFYIIPTLKIIGKTIYIRTTNLPNRKTRYEKYKDMWGLLNHTDITKI